MDKVIAFALYLLCLSPSAVFGEARAFSGKYPIKVVATVGMIGDVLEKVGGEHLRVFTLIGSGGDPHLYKASPRDMVLLTQADIIFYNGLFLEGKMAEILKQLNEKKVSLAVGEQVDPSRLLKPSQFEGHYDPHIWMDVSIWQQVVTAIRDQLMAFDPKHREDYEAHSSAYLAELDKLHNETRLLIASIPATQRVLVTAHDAFNYFGRAYGIEVKGIQGISTESEAGLKDINSLVDYLVERKVNAVFVESSVSQRNIMALVEGTRSRGHNISIGGELFSDAMGAPGTENGTYIGMIKHNAHLIAASLGGETR